MAGMDGIEVTFDRPRRLRYSIRALRELCTSLGGITLLDLLQRLGGIDLNALNAAIRYGLLHEDPKMTPKQAEVLLEAHIAKHGNITRINDAIATLINESGLISREPELGEAGGDRSA